MLKQNPIRANALLFFILMTSSLSAHAYIGPGLGAGTIGVVLGVLLSIVLVLLAIVWYPVKRLLKKRQNGKEGAAISAKKEDNKLEN